MTFDPSPIRRRTLLAAAALLPAVGAQAQSTGQGTPLAIENFFKEPSLRGLRLSPSGTHMAGIRPYNGRDNLVVFDLATRKTLVITNFRDADVSWVEWVNPDRLIFSFFDRTRGSGDQMNGGLSTIRRDASEHRVLAERSLLSDGSKLLPVGSVFAGRLRDKEGRSTDEVLIETPRHQGRGRFDVQLYRMNVANGQFSPLDISGAPPKVASWTLDRDHVPRIATTVDDEGLTQLHYREGAGKPWRVLLSFNAEDGTKAVSPIAFDRAGQLYVNAYGGSDYQGVYKLSTATGALDSEPIVAVKGFDVGNDLIFTPSGDRLLGVAVETDRRSVVWFDAARAKLQAEIDKALPGFDNNLQVPSEAPDSAPVLVVSQSDREAGRFFLYDRASGKLMSAGAARPWIQADQMQPTRFFRYDARDGLSIPAQLTTPAGPGPFPLVVLHYGGPWVRAIHSGWDPHVQFLVSRGYAVFMPAPRASTGFGYKLFRAGWKQWGLGMQDDVTDGVRKLIADGVADPKRVALLGASYGGYLTMMGLAKEPALFKAGVNWIGVTDPSFMFTVSWTDFNRADSGRFIMERLIGDPDKDKAQFDATSPVKRAAEIKQPVLMAYGGLDQRVPIINGEKMREALKPHNRQVEWVVYPDEGHGWSRLDNNLDFWGRVERFLGAHLKA